MNEFDFGFLGINLLFSIIWIGGVFLVSFCHLNELVLKMFFE